MRSFIAVFILIAAFVMAALGSDCQLERCTREIAPVCGFNGECRKMFHNECIMRNYNCETQDEFQTASLDLCDGYCL